ncbi:IS66 family transposase [Saccharopolyspora pogona]|uniref:IS66 family transposase n=1 Tax=Saccharopolyspora pogona TaxID=333966 RepID=UPI0016879204|nr:transposase [Saccharopolyspora pogona]
MIQDLAGSVIVHDRYRNYDSAELGELTHQLCCAHLGRDLDGAGEVYPDAHWPTQIADVSIKWHTGASDDAQLAQALAELRESTMADLGEGNPA